MSKRFLALLLIVPMLVCCKGNAQKDNDTTPEIPDPVDEPEDPAPMIENGGTYLATNENVDKFLSEVNYPDNDWSYTKIFDYYGGFDGTNFDWNHVPDSDRPNSYSIRWTANDGAGELVLHLEDKLGWSTDTTIEQGEDFINISNLVPNDEYTYKVTASNGDVMTEGKFYTTGHVHQVFFKTKCRNARDLGGWVTADGTKRIKYRKIYRGGRMNDRWDKMLSKNGKRDLLAEGIGAELELRGSDDYLDKPAIAGLDHCAPIIEEGGTTMLGVGTGSNGDIIEWLISEGKIKASEKDTYKVKMQDREDFKTAYKAKTKQCFDFVRNSVKAGKGVYFHCSLGRDRTGTLQILLMGILGVREGDIGKEYELTYFAPVGYSVSSSDKASNPIPTFRNDRTRWVYSDVVPYFWKQSKDGTFYDGVRNYLLSIGVTQAEIDEFRNLMLEPVPAN